VSGSAGRRVYEEQYYQDFNLIGILEEYDDEDCPHDNFEIEP
jgi:hypothetical protein